MQDWFPEREFFMRSQGQVRFIKISSKLQKRTAALALTASLAVVGSMGVMSVLQYRSSVERVALMEREADVATSEERLEAYRANLGAVTKDLQKRQEFLDVLARHPQLRGVHDLRTRTSGTRDFVQFHAAVDPNMTVARAHEVMDELEEWIGHEFPGVEVLIHPDPEGLVDEEGVAAEELLPELAERPDEERPAR